MAEYCSAGDVKKRATRNGWRHIADRDRDGVISTTESGEVDDAIVWAGALIDETLAPVLEPEDARGQSNRWLKDRCIDLAVYRLFSNGGDDVPTSILRGYDDATDALDRVRSGQTKVPGLTYTVPGSFATTKVPRGYMPR